MHPPPSFQSRPTSLTAKGDYFEGEFFAMGCPCQVLMETTDVDLAEQLLGKVRDEAWRIEALWSRYLPSSLVQQINEHPEEAHILDGETAAVLNYCEELWQLSDGAFDITSGILRNVWTFDGGNHVPCQREVEDVLQCIGWQRVDWSSPTLQMRPGMQIDLGGVGKEYAVDLCSARLAQHSDISCLVNFGGDCAVSRAPALRSGWEVGIERVDTPGTASEKINLAVGALATSGNAHRFVWHEGKKLSHILDARTGWPVAHGPRSITVQATSCLEAGMFATLACLQGEGAAEMLEAGPEKYWIQH